ncbi:MAG: glycosyltransferase family 4 protein [Candidatus Bathyarchaeia archaeon]
MAKLRLAVFNTQPPHLYFGGVERRIMETAKLIEPEADFTVYCGTKAGFNEPTQIGGAKLVPCYSTDIMFPLDNWIFNRNLTKQAAKIDAEVFEAHAVSGYGFPKKLKQLDINKPFIHTIHGVLADEYQQAKANPHQSMRDKVANRLMHHLGELEKRTAQNATLIVTISNYSLQKINQNYGISEDKVRIVPNGVDTEKFKPTNDATETRKQFGFGNEPVVLFVGSLISRKGLPLLVKAAEKVVKDRPDTKFLLVGDGPLRENLDATLKQVNLGGNFVFLTNIRDEVLPTIYNCADVFVLPSIQEGQGIVLLEAQACGVPVVAFDIGGVNEAVHAGETGLLAERGNTDALADSLLKLVNDEALRKQMGLAGRRFVSENFTWKLCVKRMLEVYRSVL